MKTISQSLYTVESWAAKPTEKKQIVAGQEVTKTTLLDLSDKSFFFPDWPYKNHPEKGHGQISSKTSSHCKKNKMSTCSKIQVCFRVEHGINVNENQNKSSAKTSKSLTVHRFRIISVSGTNLFRGIPFCQPLQKTRSYQDHLGFTKIIRRGQVLYITPLKNAKLKVYHDILEDVPKCYQDIARMYHLKKGGNLHLSRWKFHVHIRF